MNKKMIKPRCLKSGDTIAAVSLSWGGPHTFPHRYEAGKCQLEDEFGVQVVEMPHTLSDAGWLDANPQARAEDLMMAFADPAIDGIISTIGGDDSIRILPFLNLDVISNNPKVFMGYSDTTITHFACLKAGLVSFYGPAVMAGFGENDGLFPYMVKAVRRTLFSSDPIGEIEANIDGWTVEHLDWAEPGLQTQKRKLNPCTGWKFLQGKGTHRGHLIGGCFEVLEWLRGTDFWPPLPEWRNAVLFIDTSEEAPTPVLVTRGLRVMAAMGILKELSAILFGRPGGQVAIEDFNNYDNAILKVVAEEEGLRDLPIITNMDFGHTDPMTVLPYGVDCEINCDKGRIRILKSAVVD